MAADGTGAAVRLTESAVSQIPSDVTPDGTQVIFMGATPNRGSDLRLLTRPEAGAAAAAAQVTALVETRFGEGGGVVSPDGHWLAYGANNSGEFEIYVRPFPSVGGELSQISTSGGTQAAWARDGREIYYRARDGAVMAVPVMATTDTWRAGTPTRLFSGTYYGAGPDQIGLGRQYDVGADGRFLMIKETAPASGAPTSLTLVLNWLEEVKRLVPRN
jgi:Tol biopolymer transport system component